MQEIIIFWSEGYPDSFLYTVIHLIFNEDLLSDREYSRNWKRNTGANTRPSFWAHIPAGGPLDTCGSSFFDDTECSRRPTQACMFFWSYLILAHSFYHAGVEPRASRSTTGHIPSLHFPFMKHFPEATHATSALYSLAIASMAIFLEAGLYSWHPCCFIALLGLPWETGESSFRYHRHCVRLFSYLAKIHSYAKCFP